MTDEQIAELEKFVNEKITAPCKIAFKEIAKDEARNS